ncbi:MAG TPA: hypothetical protein VFK02_32025 [Kofleriaceae bacterium]|nr:hypothetical protein [Kofleriaceae bacterium]
MNPNVLILQKAWALLWDPSSSYYLPNILQNGGTFGTTTIPSLAQVTIPDVPAIPLYSSSTWGDVDITLSSMLLSGLPAIQAQAFVPASDASSVSATVAFSKLTFAGLYKVDGTGLVGCGMDLAESSAYQGGGAGAASAQGSGPPPANMDLARGYRDQLAQTNNGIALVSKYYDHNDTVNLILGQDNAFTEAWPGNAPTNPPANNTWYYMQVTSNAGANPGDPSYQVGGNNIGYLTHSAYMQSMLIGTCQYYAKQDPDNAEQYLALASDASTFQGYTNQYPDPMTVDEVLSAVQNTTPMSAAALAAVREPDAVRIGREAAARDFDALHNRALARHAARVAQATTYKSTGRFQFSFAMPTLTLTGTVAISGIPPSQTLTVTLTGLTAAIPSIAIDLLTGTDPSFTADAQDQINNAQWFQKVLGTKLNAQLGSASVLSYLSGIFNQAITGALAGA